MGTEPSDAFEAIGNELRSQILRVLWDNRHEPLSFSELYDLVDVSDTGQFNYHLSKLTPNYVERSAGGYTLRNTGIKLVIDLLQDLPTENPLEQPATTESSCVHCNDDLTAQYTDGWLKLWCPGCDQTYAHYPFPQAGLRDRTIAEILAAFDAYLKHVFSLASAGVCPNCTATTRTTRHDPATTDPTFEVAIQYTCDHCSAEFICPVGRSLLDHPRVVAFHAEQGIDLASTPSWELAWCYDPSAITLLSEDTLELAVQIAGITSDLHVRLDETFSVVDIAEQNR